MRPDENGGGGKDEAQQQSRASRGPWTREGGHARGLCCGFHIRSSVRAIQGHAWRRVGENSIFFLPGSPAFFSRPRWLGKHADWRSWQEVHCMHACAAWHWIGARRMDLTISLFRTAPIHTRVMSIGSIQPSREQDVCCPTCSAMLKPSPAAAEHGLSFSHAMCRQLLVRMIVSRPSILSSFVDVFLPKGRPTAARCSSSRPMRCRSTSRAPWSRASCPDPRPDLTLQGMGFRLLTNTASGSGPDRVVTRSQQGRMRPDGLLRSIRAETRPSRRVPFLGARQGPHRGSNLGGSRISGTQPQQWSGRHCWRRASQEKRSVLGL